MRAVGAWNTWYRVAGSVVAVAVVTGAIELAKPYVPVLSLGVLYILAVLPVAIALGPCVRGRGVGRSMLAFNFFFLPPLYTLTISDSRNWFALVVFLVTAVVVSELAARSRRRADESALLARVATSLLEHGDVSRRSSSAIAGRGGARAAASSGRGSRSAPRRPPKRARWRSRSSPATGALGTIFVPDGSERQSAARPAAAAGAGLAARASRSIASGSRCEALEAETLRRSDAVKTAVLQAVSHDLRTPLATIETALGSLRSGSLDADGRGPQRPARDDRRRARPARSGSSRTCSTSRGCRREPPSRSRAVDGRAAGGGRARRGRRAPSASRSSLADDLPLVRVDGAPDPARAREPARERAQVLAADGTGPAPRESGRATRS